MIKITCDICMDLMPLVQDNVASADSIAIVKQHLETCSECRAMFEGQMPAPSDGNQIIKKTQRKIHTFLSMVLMFGVFFGLSLTATSELFFNSLIMPILGCIGYYLFQWKALYITPTLLLITHFIINTFRLIRGLEYLDIASLFMWTAIYSFFSIIGTIIAGLIHFALRKEDSYEKENF